MAHGKTHYTVEELTRRFRLVGEVGVVEEQARVGGLEFLRRGLGVGAGDAEGSVGMTGVRCGDSDAGDSFDVREGGVTDPVGANTELGGPRQVLQTPATSGTGASSDQPRTRSSRGTGADGCHPSAMSTPAGPVPPSYSSAALRASGWRLASK